MSPFVAKLAAVLMFLVLIAALAVISLNYSGEQPNLPLVDAASDDCPLANPCLTQACEPRKPPFGGVDPDAGEHDQRRLV